MKLQDTREAYGDASSSASTIARQLAFAALAAVWIFKTDLPDKQIAVPHALILPSFLAILTLSLDLFQYAYKALVWGYFNRHMEHKTNRDEEKEFGAPYWLNWPAFALFWLKIISVAVSHGILLHYLWVSVRH